MKPPETKTPYEALLQLTGRKIADQIREVQETEVILDNGLAEQIVRQHMTSKPQVSSDPDVNWQNDAIQFPRLIAELEACGGFTVSVLSRVAKETDLKVSDILQIVERAQYVWDDVKARTEQPPS